MTASCPRFLSAHLTPFSSASLFTVYGHIMTSLYGHMSHQTSWRSWLHCLGHAEGQDALHQGKVTMWCSQILKLQVREWLEETLRPGVLMCRRVGQGAMHQRSTRHIRCLPNFEHLQSWILTRHSLFLLISWAQNKTSDTSASLSGPSTWLNTFHVQLLTWNLGFRIIWCLTNEGKYFSLSPTLRLSSFSCQNLCFYFPSSSFEFSSAALTSKHRIQPGGDRQVTSLQIFTSRLPSRQNIITMY